MAPITYVYMELRYVVIALLLLLVILSGYTDLRARIIPNLVTYPAMLLGLAFNGILGGGAQGGADGIISASLGLFVGGAVFLPFFLTGGFEGGDVKLMAAIGSLGGLRFVIGAILLTALAGALVAFVVILRSGAWRSTLRNLGRLLRFKQVEPPPGDAAPLTVPYGVAIALGTIAAIAMELGGRSLF